MRRRVTGMEIQNEALPGMEEVLDNVRWRAESSVKVAGSERHTAVVGGVCRT